MTSPPHIGIADGRGSWAGQIAIIATMVAVARPVTRLVQMPDDYEAYLVHVFVALTGVANQVKITNSSSGAAQRRAHSKVPGPCKKGT